MEQPRKKLSLNVLPDQERISRIVERGGQGAGGEGEVEVEGGGQLLPPADWPIEKKLIFGKVIAALKSVYDPEIPVDIYELGLVYRIDISEEKVANLEMTLTAPGCPVADQLLQEVEAKVEAIPEITEARVNLVWSPPWSKDRMSEAARLHLGL